MFLDLTALRLQAFLPLLTFERTTFLIEFEPKIREKTQKTQEKPLFIEFAPLNVPGLDRTETARLLEQKKKSQQNLSQKKK